MAATYALSRWAAVTLAALVLGPALAVATVLARIVLAPPWVAYTNAFYGALGAAGLPVLIAGLVMRRIRGWRWLGAVVLGVLLTLFLSVLLSPLLVELENCRVAPAAAGVQRYVCDFRTYQQSVIEYVLEGPAGWPVVRITEVRY